MKIAAQEEMSLQQGVYAAWSGPTYETPAERRFLRIIGGDAVGMSTVPEVLVARAIGLRCLAFSMITNKGTGLSEQTLSHQEVMEVGGRAGAALGRLIVGVLSGLPDLSHSGDAK